MSAYLLDCIRTPRTKARENGSLANTLPAQLVAELVAAQRERQVDVESSEALLLGCVGQTGAQGGNVALHSKLHASLPDACAAMTLNHFCVSGLSSVGLAANACALAQYRQVLAGGVECMSQVPFMADRAAYYQDAGLPPSRRYLPVALSADLLATAENVSRAELDAATAESHRRAAEAERYQSSLVAVNNASGESVSADECIRPGTSEESLAAMAPGFAPLAEGYRDALADRRIEFCHSIANAPPMVDGAALAVVAGEDQRAHARARIVAWTDAAGSPEESLTGGMAAMDKLLHQQGLTLGDIDRIEFMEAFAVVPVLFQRRYQVDPAKVNVSGGHLAKGHPMGATGAVLLSTLCDVLEADDKSLGLVVATGAGGVGSAMLVERLR